jgi:flagellar biosynthetic protein FlhB
MASEADSGERTEEATQQRREDYRKRGQVAQTRELSSVLLLFASVLAIAVLGQYYFQQITELFYLSFGDELAANVREGRVNVLATFAAVKFAYMILPIMGLLLVIALVSTVVQTGFLYNEEALQLRWERMDPVAGFKKMFSLRALIEGFKAVLKVGVILFISYLLLRDHIMVLPRLMDFSIGQILSFLGSLTIRLLSGVGLFMLVLAGADYFYQRWELEKEMRMTKQEIKEEHKSREGDPMIRARIKRIQREMASKRMMTEVPKADVIVTNPTHLAVALKYDETMVAPTVIAMGADNVAMKIRELAKEFDIPIVENKPLARAIFKTLKIGQQIPRELYTAVAEVLSYVFRLRKKKAVK